MSANIFGFALMFIAAILLLTPYCHCDVPLSKRAYIAGALMPLIVLGILPGIVGVVIGSLSPLIIPDSDVVPGRGQRRPRQVEPPPPRQQLVGQLMLAEEFY